VVEYKHIAPVVVAVQLDTAYLVRLILALEQVESKKRQSPHGSFLSCEKS
jgi:hypothetical protein